MVLYFKKNKNKLDNRMKIKKKKIINNFKVINFII